MLKRNRVMLLCKIISSSSTPKLCLRILDITKRGRELAFTRWHTTNTLEAAYQATKEKCDSKKLPKDVDVKAVFACNELDLKEVKVYGFDYDYTLACYKPSLDYLLYNLGRQTLIEQFKYPKPIGELQYKPGFAIRGLHYDIEKGVLLKLDSFLQIQFGTVYRGLTPLTNDEVLQLYKNRVIPIAYVEARTQLEQDAYTKMVQLADLFSVPEMTLLCNVADYFERKHIDFHPEILFRDVKNSFKNSHPIMHKIVEQNVEMYLRHSEDLRIFFDRLVAAGKKLFLVTNSPYRFVNCFLPRKNFPTKDGCPSLHLKDYPLLRLGFKSYKKYLEFCRCGNYILSSKPNNKGMSMLIGYDWKEYFDVLIVQARKPRFFTDTSRPMRLFDEDTCTHVWDRVSKFEKGKIYYEGTVKQLQDITGWRGHQVLYFGDHPYSDLADVTLEHGWRTGAIINELSHEIETLNRTDFKQNANWLQMLTQLIEEHQDCEDPNEQIILENWMQERDLLRNEIKFVFNEQFGSVFRTYHNPTYFSRRLFRFADIYTSNISNLLNYSVNHTFYPRRGVMPHEYSSYFV